MPKLPKRQHPLPPLFPQPEPPPPLKPLGGSQPANGNCPPTSRPRKTAKKHEPKSYHFRRCFLLGCKKRTKRTAGT